MKVAFVEELRNISSTKSTESPVNRSTSPGLLILPLDGSIVPILPSRDLPGSLSTYTSIQRFTRVSEYLYFHQRFTRVSEYLYFHPEVYQGL